MKPFRKHVAIAIDGGGIRGIVVARALSMLEEALQTPSYQIFRLAVGTSTGSIISAAVAAGYSAQAIHGLYLKLGKTIFQKTWRSFFFPLTRYRYSPDPLNTALNEYLDQRKMGDFWTGSDPFDLVITAFDIATNHTRFIKSWKKEYQDWLVTEAVQASSSVPTYFPPVKGRYIDGGVGSYSNPCYIAAYEAMFCLGWDPAETTLISLGTGRDLHHPQIEDVQKYMPWQWINPILGAFLQSADDQQVHLVQTFFQALDFRRFQVDLQQTFEMDDPSRMDELTAYGEELGRKILQDLTDPAMDIKISKAVAP
ncbi:MAG TPA: patatin-like phospholipase family protein [Anaerolineaceae bacterium]